jgi:hypothetical protein
LWREVLDMTVCQIKSTGLIDDEAGQSLLEQIHSGIEQGKLFFRFDFSSVHTFDEQTTPETISSLGKDFSDQKFQYHCLLISFSIKLMFVPGC